MPSLALNRPLQTRRVLVYTDRVTAATGVVNSYGFTTATVTSCDPWGAYSGAFMEYRVRSFRACVIPRLNQALPATYLDNSAIVTATFAGTTSGPTLVNDYVSSSGFRFFPAWPMLRPGDALVVEADHRLNPSADLWSNTSGPPTTLSLMGAALRQLDAASAAFNGIIVWDILLQFDVEFRGAR